MSKFKVGSYYRMDYWHESNHKDTVVKIVTDVYLTTEGRGTGQPYRKAVAGLVYWHGSAFGAELTEWYANGRYYLDKPSMMDLTQAIECDEEGDIV